MASDFQAEREAFQRFAKVLSDVEECKRLFEMAGVPIPDPLRRMLGGSNGNGKPSLPKVHIMPPERASQPLGVQPDWLSVKLGDVSATAIVQGVLRMSKVPVKARDVIDLVTEINPNIPRGSINNIGTRLSGTLIKRTLEGWSLVHPENAGIIYEGFLWGPKAVFDKTDIAAHRREAIIHILKAFPGGLQTVQMVEQLRNCNWVQAPASKDLVKADMELLEGHDKVRKISNSRKWELIAQD